MDVDDDEIEEYESDASSDRAQHMLEERLQEEDDLDEQAAAEFEELELPSPAPTSIDSETTTDPPPSSPLLDVCFCGRGRPGELRIISEAPCPRHDLGAGMTASTMQSTAVDASRTCSLFVSPLAGGTMVVPFVPGATIWRDIYLKVASVTGVPFLTFLLLLEGRPCENLDGLLLVSHRDSRVCQSGWLRGGGADLDEDLHSDDGSDAKYRKTLEGKGNGIASSSGCGIGKGVDTLKVDANQQFRDLIKCDVSAMMQQFGERLCSRFETSISASVRELKDSHAQTQRDLKEIHHRLDIEAGERKMLKVELNDRIEKIKVDSGAPPSPPSCSQPHVMSAHSPQKASEEEILAVIGAWPKRSRSAVVRQDIELILSKLPASAKESLVETWVPGASSKVGFARFSNWGGLWAFVRAVKQTRVVNTRFNDQDGVRHFWASKSKTSEEPKRVGPVSRGVYWLKTKLGINKNSEDDASSSAPVRDVAGEYAVGREGIFATTCSWSSESRLVDLSLPRDQQVDSALLQQVCPDASAVELLNYIHGGN